MRSVRNYTDKQLLNRIEEVGGKIPNYGKYHIIGVQNRSDHFNIFDDKFYVYDGPSFRMRAFGTTNVGKTALEHFDSYNLPGAAVWKTDMFYEDLYLPGYHKGRMKALREQKPIYFYRDSDKDQFAEEQGELFFDNIYANMHGVSYDPFSETIATKINGWSFACQVWCNMSDYKNMIKAVWERKKHVNYTLLKEFDP